MDFYTTCATIAFYFVLSVLMVAIPTYIILSAKMLRSFFKKRKQKIAFEQAKRKFIKFIKECGILEELSQFSSLNINNLIDDYGLKQWEMEILTKEVHKIKVEKLEKEKEDKRKKFFENWKSK
tara:strand:+ start:369 stop:737 length:369 start_codon:yes stop_codon:yes gene_type:complete